MNIAFTRKQIENPFDMASLANIRKKKGAKTYSEDWWGCASIEKYADQCDLFNTHEDAGGWINYLERFRPKNFWYADGNTGVWFWYEDYDNWQDTYGADAVLAVYHAGHGGMDGNGVFYLPMGSNWEGQTTAISSNMRLGNEQTNYVFLSTCESLRVLDGHNPIRTWQPANLGFRMLFGSDSLTEDHPGYGYWFWEQWKTGKSLSTAWLDANWYYVSKHQVPSVVACGATADEARDRVFNERYLNWDHVSSAWWSWRWYDAARGAEFTRESNRALPKELLVGELKPVEIDEQHITNIAERYGVASKFTRKESASDNATFYLKEGQTRLAFRSDGSHEVQLSSPNLSNREQISLNKAKKIAENSMRRFGFDQNVELIFDGIRLSYEAGGNAEAKDRNGAIEGPYVTETTIQFKQVINGVPVITPGVGDVAVSVDNDGSITSVNCSTRQVARLSDRPKNTTSAPRTEGRVGAASETEGSPFAEPKARDIEGIDQLLAEEWQKRLVSWVIGCKKPLQYTTVPGSTEVGYDIKGNDARLAARKLIEVDFGSGFRKRYSVVAPILE
jgi:hypothetical protein